jgi:oligopeptide transport system ATP-binding protein
MTEMQLSVRDLHVTFDTYAGRVRAVNGITFDVQRNEMVGLVGESGCGKSVTGLSILRMVPQPGIITAGRIMFEGEDLLGKSKAEMQSIRGRRIAMIFQDPAATLNPVFTCGSQITRIIRQHTSATRREAGQRAIEMFTAVALPDPERILRTYPHELSGGMQQRVMIAMSLAAGARLLIADEPTTALDVTIQAQILALLADLKARGLAILLITHNLAVVAETCDRVAVAYAGKVVEEGRTRDVLSRAKHPYTMGLLAALPRPALRGKPLSSVEGAVPDGIHLPSGCVFHPRCAKVMEVCRTTEPKLAPVGAPGHAAACHLYPQEGVE